MQLFLLMIIPGIIGIWVYVLVATLTAKLSNDKNDI